MNKKKLTKLVQVAIFGSAPCLAMAADPIEVTDKSHSQNTAKTPKQVAEHNVEKITVTGSRIRRDSFSVTTPLATLDKDAIEDAGIGSLASILVEEMPQLSEGTSNSNSQSSVQNTGLSTIDLRELGVNRTLTLIDGRRVVSNSYSGNYVSLSTIPSSFVDKVEIITGGASAAYGSDAVAGVVNIITKKDQHGFSINTRGGGALDGGGEEFSIDADYGGSYAGGPVICLWLPPLKKNMAWIFMTENEHSSRTAGNTTLSRCVTPC